MTLALLTLLLIIGGLAVGQTAMDSNVMGFVGQDLLLPCPCSDEHSKLLWQKDDRIVNIYPQDEINSIDQSYKDRTLLFQNKEERNCSLLFLNLTVTDSGVYTCYPLVSVGDGIWENDWISVNLTVSDNKKTERSELEGNPNVPERDTHFSGVLVPIVVLILAVGALLTLLIRRRHQNNTNTTSASPSDPMIV